MSLTYYFVNSSDVQKYGYPSKEGECFKYNDDTNLHLYQIISDFEANFRKYAKGYETYSFSKAGTKDISIPVPIPQWDKKFLIFETQKYLNYYGFDAGPADGIIGKRTSAAVIKFSEEHEIESKDIKEVNKILKQMYLARPYSERSRVINLSPHERDRLFGFKRAP